MYHFLPLYFMYNLQHFSPKNGLKPTKVVQISFTVYILVTWVKLSKCKITVAIKLTPYEKFKSLVYLAFNLHVCLCMHSCFHHTSAFHHVISARHCQHGTKQGKAKIRLTNFRIHSPAFTQLEDYRVPNYTQ